MKYFEEVNRLRGIACIMVMLVHMIMCVPVPYLRRTLPMFLGVGQGAVYIFFVISGFMVTYHMKDRLDLLQCDSAIDRIFEAKSWLKEFWIKRIYRLFPVVLFALFLMCIFYLDVATEYLYSIFRVCIDTLFCVHNVSCAHYQGTERVFLDGASPLWTLSIEGMFYIIYPLLLISLKNNLSRIYVTLWIAIINMLVVRPVLMVLLGQMQYYYSYFSGVESLMFGSLIALLYDRFDQGKNRRVLSIVLCMIVWIYTSLIYRATPVLLMKTPMTHFVTVMSSVFLVLWAVTDSKVLDIPVIKDVLSFIGKRSYTYYVMHLPLWVMWNAYNRYFINAKYFSKLGYQRIVCFWYFIILIVVCEFVYRFIEKRFYNVGKKIASKETV